LVIKLLFWTYMYSFLYRALIVLITPQIQNLYLVRFPGRTFQITVKVYTVLKSLVSVHYLEK